MENPFKRANRASSTGAKPDGPGPEARGQGRLHGYGPVAVIDIGSNSVRLVAYERLSRALTPLYNEKVLCGLGKGLAKTGRLSDDASELALSTLARFRHLADQMQVRSLKVIATAAVREASNGQDFIDQAEAIVKTELSILSGMQEARAAALGIQAGFFDPDGYVGDLGGGSLELVRIDKVGIGAGVSHKLGVIRLLEEADGDAKAAAKLAKKVLEGDALTAELKGRTLYLVGGTWRNLAKLHMATTDYPLSVMHGYSVDADTFADFCADVVKGKYADDPGMQEVSRSRKTLLPFGAAVLLALFEVGEPKDVVMSALGVREGLLYADLAPHEQSRDPLLDAAYELAVLRSRSPAHARELAQWTGDAFRALGFSESVYEARMRQAASLLADIGWRAHTDYRGTQSHNIIAHGAFAGIDHPGRLFLAMANYYRYEGLSEAQMDKAFAAIASDDLRRRARLLGALFRVAYALTASMAGVLPDTRFSCPGEGTLELVLPESLRGLQGERLTKRVNALGRLLDRPETTVRVEESPKGAAAQA
ncbi:MAG: Ppx/GppA family phosphatase [Devosiaceae bacterium]|nr:Ppx/GppA family phosphatase [Devosiaceae bacterium MH13]